MATTNLGLTQYSSADKIDFLTKYNGDMTKIDTATGKLSNLTTTNKANLVSAINENVTNTGILASLKTQDKTSVVNSINEVYDTTDNGWISARATLTYASASAPTFVCNTSIDLTTRISVGMKIKLTQTTVKYFFVTAITSNSITLYGGMDYVLTNTAITYVCYSVVQSPHGFPIASTGLGVDFIIEKGSNANGSYTKWASGEMTCNGTNQGSKRIMFPASFVETPKVFVDGWVVLDSNPPYKTLSGATNVSLSYFDLVTYGFDQIGVAGVAVINAAFVQTMARANFGGTSIWKAVGRWK